MTARFTTMPKGRGKPRTLKCLSGRSWFPPVRLWHTANENLLQNRSRDAVDARYEHHDLVDDEGSVVSAVASDRVCCFPNLTSSLGHGLSWTPKNITSFGSELRPLSTPAPQTNNMDEVCEILSNRGQYANAFAQMYTQRIQCHTESLKRNEDDLGELWPKTVFVSRFGR